MTVSFQPTTATVSRGRGVKPIPDYVTGAINAALKEKSNQLFPNLTDKEAKELQNDFNRLRRQGGYSFTVSVRPDENAKGKLALLLADVARVK